MKDIIITSFTDPLCVWCWATEPVFRAIETRYPTVEIRTVMGGMIRDMNDFSDPNNGIDAGPDGVDAQIAHHWLESAPVHGMPVEADGFALFKKGPPSSFPQNIAYKAAQIATPARADRFLHAVRAATIAQAKITSLPEVLSGIARESGVDVPAFERALTDGSAERAFKMDIALAQSVGVSVFPTFLVKSSAAREMVLRGYNRLHDFKQVFDRLTGGELQPLASPPDADVLAWLADSHGPLAMEEVFKAFDFDSRAQADNWVDKLVKDGLYTREPAGTGFLLTPTMQGDAV